MFIVLFTAKRHIFASVRNKKVITSCKHQQNDKID